MSKREMEEHLQTLVDCTHFDIDEVKLLEEMFQTLCAGAEVKSFSESSSSTSTKVVHLTRPRLRDVLMNCFDMCDDFMMDRTFHSFASQKDYDQRVTVDLWVQGMSVFLRGDLEEKISFCFRVYDINMNEEISRDEMYTLLLQAIVKAPSQEDRDEAIRDLIELVLKSWQLTKPSIITKEDFMVNVKANQLRLEVFGHCIPSTKQAKDFLTLKVANSMKSWK